MMRGFVLGVAVGAIGMGLYTGNIQINVDKLKKEMAKVTDTETPIAETPIVETPNPEMP